MFFSKKPMPYLKKIDECINELEKYGLSLFARNNNLDDCLNSDDYDKKLDVILKFMLDSLEEVSYWKTFKKTYPVAFFAVTEDRKFIE